MNNSESRTTGISGSKLREMIEYQPPKSQQPRTRYRRALTAVSFHCWEILGVGATGTLIASVASGHPLDRGQQIAALVMMAGWIALSAWQRHTARKQRAEVASLRRQINLAMQRQKARWS